MEQLSNFLIKGLFKFTVKVLQAKELGQQMFLPIVLLTSKTQELLFLNEKLVSGLVFVFRIKPLGTLLVFNCTLFASDFARSLACNVMSCIATSTHII